MGRFCALFLVLCSLVEARSLEMDRALELYHRTQYTQSLAVLQSIPNKERDSEALSLIGQNYFMMGEYKKSTEVFEKAIALEPKNAEYHHWLGRTFGRRAETSNPFSAPGYASKARQMFETAVALDPSNQEAVNDLFDFYLQAPGFLGGGLHKAEALAQHIAKLDAAEGHYAQAQIDDKRKDYDGAEQQLRRAAEIAPRQVGRVLDVAKYLAKRGRIKESEAMFDQAAKMAPDSPRVWFERANTYVQEQRNLNEARRLLERYVKSSLTPDDPPREQAEALLKKIGA
jgi:tetratricopeptide (TPR) repeat protein